MRQSQQNASAFLETSMAQSVVPDQAVCSGPTLFAPILNLSVMLGNVLMQTTSADDIFRCIIFLGALRVNSLQRVDHFFCKYTCAINFKIFCCMLP